MHKTLLLVFGLLVFASGSASRVTPLTAQIVQGGEPDEYPPDVLCSPKGDIFHGLQTPDHPCVCTRMAYTADPDGCCDANAPHKLDTRCKQFCHEQHCACPVICPTPDGGSR